MAEETYIFKNGKVYTFVGGKVVAAVPEEQFADGAPNENPGGPVQMPQPPQGLGDDLSDAATCQSCGSQSSPEDQFCAQCGEPLAHFGNEPDGGVPGADLYGTEPPVDSHALANTITTPNGLTGKILGRVATVWGEEVTVRFENGVIKRLPVAAVTLSQEDEGAGDDPVSKLASRLNESYQSDRDSLIRRRADLVSIQRQAHKLAADGDDDAAPIHVQAGAEIKEIDQALAYLASKEAEAFEPTAPIDKMPHVQQASMGGASADWLDKTIAGIHAEAQATNYERLMDEGPEALVAGLDDAQLADTGTTRAIASRWIRSHTVGADEDTRDKYEKVWLTRVEELRKSAYTERKGEMKREAAANDSVYDGPDEALFL